MSTTDRVIVLEHYEPAEFKERAFALLSKLTPCELFGIEDNFSDLCWKLMQSVPLATMLANTPEEWLSELSREMENYLVNDMGCDHVMELFNAGKLTGHGHEKRIHALHKCRVVICDVRPI